MKTKKKDAFKKIIKLAADDLPQPVDFTAAVMNTIEADVQREAAFKSLLQQQPRESAPFNFTAAVMVQIVAQAQPLVYKPVIGKKAWYGIAAGVAVFLMLIGIVNKPQQASSKQNWLPADALKLMHAVPFIYFIGILIAAALLFLDYMLTRLSSRNRLTTT